MPPAAPGTFGTAVAFLIALAVSHLPGLFPKLVIGGLFLLLLIPAIRFSTEAEAYFGEKDPQQVVIDEVLGFFVTIMFHPLTAPVLISAFILFRLFDIAKPFPINNVQKLRGGAGVVFDDLIAGVYANLSLTLILFLYSRFGGGVSVL